MSPILILLGAAVAALMLSLLISLACAGLKPSRMAPAKGTMTLIAVMTAIEAGTELTGTGPEPAGFSDWAEPARFPRSPTRTCTSARNTSSGTWPG